MKVKFVGDGWELKPENNNDRKMIDDLYFKHHDNMKKHGLSSSQKLVVSTKLVKEKVYHKIWTYG